MSALACTARPRTVALTAPQTAGRIPFDDTGRLPRGQSVAPCPDVGRLTRPDGHGTLGAVPVESAFLVLGSGIAGLTCALECARAGDRKSTRLNSSHSQISYAVFCLKKKKKKKIKNKIKKKKKTKHK